MTRRDFIAAIGAAAVAGQAVPASSLQRRGAQSASRTPSTAGRVQVLESVAAVPPEIVGAFREPVAFQQAASGQYFVLDRRGHIVYGIDRDLNTTWKIVQIGQETGRVLDPTGFSVAPNGTFVVADRPRALERVQVFGSGGALLNGFTLPGRAAERLTLGGIVLNGVASLQYSGRSVFINQPESGALASEVHRPGLRHPHIRHASPDRARNRIGRSTSALNTGLPLVNPRGGFFFVFQAGVPVFRRLNDAGELVFERHVEGPELDVLIQGLPTTWPRRKAGRRRATDPGHAPRDPHCGGGSVGPPVDRVRGRALHVRVRCAGRAHPRGAVPRRRHHRTLGIVLRAGWPPAGRTRLLHLSAVRHREKLLEAGNGQLKNCMTRRLLVPVVQLSGAALDDHAD